MSARPPSDEELDSQLSALGNPVGSAPRTSAQQILAMAAQPVPGRVGLGRSWRVMGLAAAALIVGFAAGRWWTLGERAVEPEVIQETPAQALPEQGLEDAQVPGETSGTPGEESSGVPSGEPSGEASGTPNGTPNGTSSVMPNGEPGATPKDQPKSSYTAPKSALQGPAKTSSPLGSGASPSTGSSSTSQSSGGSATGGSASGGSAFGGSASSSPAPSSESLSAPSTPAPAPEGAVSDPETPQDASALDLQDPELLTLDLPAEPAPLDEPLEAEQVGQVSPGGERAAHRLGVGLGAQGSVNFNEADRQAQAGGALAFTWTARTRPEQRLSPYTGLGLEVDLLAQEDLLRPAVFASGGAGLSWELGEARIDTGLTLSTAGLGKPQDRPGAGPDSGPPGEQKPKAVVLMGPELAFSLGPESGLRLRTAVSTRFSPALAPGKDWGFWPSLTLGVAVPLGRKTDG